MDLFRGIEPTQPTPHDEHVEELDQSRGGSISLDGTSMGCPLPFAFASPHDSPADRPDLNKPPLLPMVPLETVVPDRPRPSSPKKGFTLLPPAADIASPSSSPGFPLQVYLKDKNDHERHLLRFSGFSSLGLDVTKLDFETEPECNGQACGGLESDGLSGSISSSWDFFERDEALKQKPSCRLSTAHGRNVEAAGVDNPVSSRHRMTRTVSLSSTDSSSPSSLAEASTLSDLVTDTLLAVRHIALHRQLQQAGLGGLGMNRHSQRRYHRAGDGISGTPRVRKPLLQRRRTESKKDT